MERRTLLIWVLNGVGALVAALLAVPALVVGLAPVIRGRGGEVWRPLGRLEEFPLDEVTLAVVELPRLDWSRSLAEKAVYVWRPSEDEVVVFSRDCTDLSCPVVYDAGSRCFYCPCHGGIFARNGERMAGPPKRPLDRYTHRVRAGELEIELNSVPAMS